MGDEVKFIFRTLLKVPCYIMVMYFVMNLFFFFFIYFKVLGVSYVVMQTAVENNYLPTSELGVLNAYVNELNRIPMVNGTANIIISNTNTTCAAPIGSVADDARIRKQYGNSVTCGVTCGFKMVWPLTYTETTVDGKGVVGNDTTRTFSGFKSEDQLKQARAAKESHNLINIKYTVPGLKYYPDLRTH